jgi:hypothetical protein
VCIRCARLADVYMRRLHAPLVLLVVVLLVVSAFCGLRSSGSCCQCICVGDVLVCSSAQAGMTPVWQLEQQIGCMLFRVVAAGHGLGPGLGAALVFLHVAVMRSTQRGCLMYIHSSRLLTAAACASQSMADLCAVLCCCGHLVRSWRYAYCCMQVHAAAVAAAGCVVCLGGASKRQILAICIQAMHSAPALAISG